MDNEYVKIKKETYDTLKDFENTQHKHEMKISELLDGGMIARSYGLFTFSRVDYYSINENDLLKDIDAISDVVRELRKEIKELESKRILGIKVF